MTYRLYISFSIVALLLPTCMAMSLAVDSGHSLVIKIKAPIHQHKLFPHDNNHQELSNSNSDHISSLSDNEENDGHTVTSTATIANHQHKHKHTHTPKPPISDSSKRVLIAVVVCLGLALLTLIVVIRHKSTINTKIRTILKKKDEIFANSHTSNGKPKDTIVLSEFINLEVEIKGSDEDTVCRQPLLQAPSSVSRPIKIQQEKSLLSITANTLFKPTIHVPATSINSPPSSFTSFSHSSSSFLPSFPSSSQQSKQVSIGDVGSLVTVKGYPDPGILRYFGPHKTNPNKKLMKCGVQFDTLTGMNNGCVDGFQYFPCAPNCGVLVSTSKVSPIQSTPLPKRRRFDPITGEKLFDINSVVSTPSASLSSSPTDDSTITSKPLIDL